MTDPTERVLRDVLTEDATRAPFPGDLTGRARRGLRRRRLRNAGAVAAGAVAVAAIATTLPFGGHRASVTSGPETLVGHNWLLDRFEVDGVDEHTPELLMLQVRQSRFDAQGCNVLAGPAEVTSTHVTLSAGTSSDMACASVEDELFAELASDPLSWTVVPAREPQTATMRLTAPDGDYMEFTESEVSPLREELVELAADGGGGAAYRVILSGDRFSVVFRAGSDEEWEERSLTVTENPGGFPPALHVPFGDRQVLAGWATPDTARAQYEHPGAAPVDLTMHSHGSRRLFTAVLPDCCDGGVVVLYRADGTVIARSS